MKDASPWIALYAALVATGSAVWQAATFVLTGGRVKVTLIAGAMNSRGMATMPPSSLSAVALAELANQGFTRPIVAVKVANVGRQPVTVTSWSLTHARGIAYGLIGGTIGKHPPFRLDVGESQTLATDLADVLDFARITEESIQSRSGYGIHGEVELGDGRTRRTSEKVYLTGHH